MTVTMDTEKGAKQEFIDQGMELAESKRKCNAQIGEMRAQVDFLMRQLQAATSSSATVDSSTEAATTDSS